MIAGTTLVEMLAARRNDARTITYLTGEEQRRETAFAELQSAALGILRHLQAFGLRAGDELILFTGNNEQFLDGFWACLLGGIVPVPVAVGISDDHRDKLLKIFQQLQRNPAIYTEQGQLSRLREYARTTGQTAVFEALEKRSLAVERIADVSQPGIPTTVSADDVAFIQFSSGSTSEPKGVLLTHRNVLANIRDIVDTANFSDQDRSLSWMPLTHDMGLIGFHLCMLGSGISHTIMDTRLFSRRPLLWLREASTSGATLLSSPNFGYKHFLKVYEAKGCDGLDLSRVRLLFNGAEPISVPLCARFLDAMEEHGLARHTMYPVYGLAEASLAVSFPAPGTPYRSVCVNRHSLQIGRAPEAAEQGTRDALELMVVGRPLGHCEVRIADDGDQRLADGAVGHVQIRGGNVTSGYYGGQHTQPFTPDGWLRTGDLGFFSGGELVITGRHKEIIFANGQNYYPSDIESIAATFAGFELGKVVAAASGAATRSSPGAPAETGTRPLHDHADEDELLLFVLHRDSLEDFLPVANRLRRCITEHTALQVAHVLPVRAIPKTTSGKLQRGRLAAAYEAGEYDDVIAAIDALREEHHGGLPEDEDRTEWTLRMICASIITDRQIRVDDDFFDLGISSLALAQIYERIDEEYPGRLDIEDLFNLPSIRAIAEHLNATVAPHDPGERGK